MGQEIHWVSKVDYAKYGKGWRAEPERHALSAKGIKTGRFQKKGYPWIYYTPFPHMPMTFEISPGSKEFLKRRASTKGVKYLLNHGWQMKVLPYDMTPYSIEMWKGKNFVYAVPTHWHKYEIRKIMLFGENEKRELERVFHKPYPYRIDEEAPEKKYKPTSTR